MTKIEFTEINWNPIKDSQICEETLLYPLKRRKATMFVLDCDIFSGFFPFEEIDKIMAVIALCPQHTFQVLTKYPERMKKYFERFNLGLKSWDGLPIVIDTYKILLQIFDLLFVKEVDTEYKSKITEWFRCGGSMPPDKRLLDNGIVKIVCPAFFRKYSKKTAHDYLFSDAFNAKIGNLKLPLPNLWLGVSVENEDHLLRIDVLRDIPAVVRFISFEPLLSNIKNINLQNIHWVIVGGESGKDARPMHPDWVRSIRNQCQEAGVPFFFKGWGDWLPLISACEADSYPKAKMQEHDNGDRFVKVSKEQSGRLLDGKEYSEYPNQTKA